jgi:ATP-dependent DNA helicase RecG
MTTTYHPPFTITPKILTLVADIFLSLGKLTVLQMLLKTIQENLKMSEKIMRLIAENNSIAIAELAGIIGVSTRTIERNLKSLKNEGGLKRVGTAKGGTWKVLGERNE